MDNQHRKITGYRELSQSDIDLMNEVKALGVAIEDALLKVRDHVHVQRVDATACDRHLLATPDRFIALAKTDFQTALMYLTRAVAQPEFF